MTFMEWFENNRENLAYLLRDDVESALYAAWISGYQEGGDALAKTVSKYLYSVDNKESLV